jgi:hypothetical protein
MSFDPTVSFQGNCILVQIKNMAYFLFFTFAMLEIEPRALDMLGNCSINELHPQSKNMIFKNPIIKEDL